MPVSRGCDNCWSARQAHRFTCGLTSSVGEVGQSSRPYYHGNIKAREDRLRIPLGIKKPTVFAVWNDLFHEDVSWRFLDKVFAVMAACPQHTFLLLTKRPEGMNEYIDRVMFDEDCNYEGWYVAVGKELPR